MVISAFKGIDISAIMGKRLSSEDMQKAQRLIEMMKAKSQSNKLRKGLTDKNLIKIRTVTKKFYGGGRNKTVVKNVSAFDMSKFKELAKNAYKNRNSNKSSE